MKAFRIKTGATIELLGDPVGEGLIQNVPLSEHQAIAARHAGCELIDVTGPDEIRCDAPYVRFPDDLYLSWAMLDAFVRQARLTPGRPAVLSLRRSRDTDRLAATQDVALTDTDVCYPVHYVVPGSNADPHPTRIDIEDGFQLRKRLPTHVLPAGEVTHHVTSKSILQIVTPLHLHLASMVAILNRVAGWKPSGLLGHTLRLAQWLGNRLPRSAGEQTAPAPPALFYKYLASRNEFGKNCDIHPSAVLEGCVLGDNVRVGAGSYLQFCHIGDNVDVSPCACVLSSCIGHDTQLVTREWISLSVIYPGCFAAPRYLQFGFVGRDAQVYPSMYYDFRLDGKPLKTRFRGSLVDAGFPFLGPIIGHRAKVAGGLSLGPGRMVPNGVTVLPNPDTVVDRIPADLQEGAVIHAGRPRKR